MPPQSTLGQVAESHVACIFVEFLLEKPMQEEVRWKIMWGFTLSNNALQVLRLTGGPEDSSRFWMWRLRTGGFQLIVKEPYSVSGFRVRQGGEGWGWGLAGGRGHYWGMDVGPDEETHCVKVISAPDFFWRYSLSLLDAAYCKTHICVFHPSLSNRLLFRKHMILLILLALC